jgi:hypothetical protein
MINNELVSVNGTDAPWKYTGTGNAATLTGENIPTAPDVVEEFHGRVFMNDGRNLRWSPFMGDWDDNWPLNNHQPFSQLPTGLKTLGARNNSMMVIANKNEIYGAFFDASLGEQIGGEGSFRFDRISKIHGCVSPYSMKECYTEQGQTVLIWADADGLKAMTPDLQIRKITEDIQPTWDGLNAAQLSNAVGVFYRPKRWYLLFCAKGTSTTHDTVIVFDLEHFVPIAVFDWVVSGAGIVEESGVEKLIGSDYSGEWFTHDSGDNDDGSAYEGFVLTKAFDGGLPDTNKGFRSMVFSYAVFGVFTVEISAFYDYLGQTFTTSFDTTGPRGLGTFVLGVDRLSTFGKPDKKGVELQGRGRIAQFKIGNSEADEPFKIHEIVINFRPGNLVMKS